MSGSTLWKRVISKLKDDEMEILLITNFNNCFSDIGLTKHNICNEFPLENDKKKETHQMQWSLSPRVDNMWITASVQELRQHLSLRLSNKNVVTSLRLSNKNVVTSCYVLVTKT